MSFEFRPAVRDKASVLVSLAGSTGSGKTFTALLLAMGLAYPGMSADEIVAAVEREGRSRVAFIDTEGGRGLHYAPASGQRADFKTTFPFLYAEITAPFTPAKYQDAVLAAEAAGAVAVVIDSMSHEYESEGGILEWADQLAEGKPKPGVASPRTYGGNWRDDWIQPPAKSPGNWKEPKRAHKRMVNRLVQVRCHLIFCLRAEEKMLLKKERNDRGYEQVKVIPAEERPLKERWEPICEKRFMYEMTASFLLLPSEPGVGVPIKLQEQHRHIFPEGQRIGLDAGVRLAAWSHGGTDVEPTITSARVTPEQWVASHEAEIAAASSLDALMELQLRSRRALEKLERDQPDLHRRAVEAGSRRHAELSEGIAA